MVKVARIVVAGVLALMTPGIAGAQAPHPAIARIEGFDTALLTATRTGGGAQQALSPTVQATFHLPTMAQFVVGPDWAKLTAPEKQAVSGALQTYLAARLNNEFDGDKQNITVDPAVKTRGPDAVVRTSVAETGESPATVDYRMRAYEGVWRVIDIYYNGVSMLATQRVDAQAAFKTGGAAGLVKHMQNAAAALH